MTEDIYKTPESGLRETSEQSSDDIIKMYSPNQVICSTFGGSVSLVYFLMSNFTTQSQPNRCIY